MKNLNSQNLNTKKCGGIFDKNVIQDSITHLQEKTTEQNFWENNKSAQSILKQISSYENELKMWKEIDEHFFEVESYIELIKEGEEVAKDAGAKVILISGPVKLKPPEGIIFERITSADEMYDAVMHYASKADIFISTAAVADYKPKNSLKKKKKKQNTEDISIELKQNKDILSSVTDKYKTLYAVGFAAETEAIEENARKKLLAKNLRVIVANDVSDQTIGFDSDDNEVTLISKKEKIVIKKTDKKRVAKKIIEFIAEDI